MTDTSTHIHGWQMKLWEKNRKQVWSQHQTLGIAAEFSCPLFPRNAPLQLCTMVSTLWDSCNETVPVPQEHMSTPVQQSSRGSLTFTLLVCIGLLENCWTQYNMVPHSFTTPESKLKRFMMILEMYIWNTYLDSMYLKYPPGGAMEMCKKPTSQLHFLYP